jgi:hypothetical protein
MAVIRKIPNIIPVASKYIATDPMVTAAVGTVMSDNQAALMEYAGIPTGETPEARAERIARETARRRESDARDEAERAEAYARRDRVIARTTDLVILAVLELHGPSSWASECEGCEVAGYEAEQPDWPCQTWRLIESLLP